MTTPLLTPEQVGEELQLPVEHVRRRIRCGDLGGINIGTDRRPMYRVPRTALDKYLADRAVTT